MIPEQKTVCIDLDGTIAHFKAWVDENHFGEPIQGAKAAITKLKLAGCRIIIFTTRANKEKIASYLNSHEIPFDEINSNVNQPQNAIGSKIIADVYIDDKAINFSGNWGKTLEQTLKFIPWEYRNKKTPNPSLSSSLTFLSNDFNECFAQMRHYDNLMWDITKFSIIQLLGVIVATWSIYSFSIASTKMLIQKYYPFVICLILFASYLFGSLAIYMLVRLRLYFSVVARYINEHRHFFLKGKPLDFSNRSGMYMDYNQPQPCDIPSSHMVSISLIAAFNSISIFAGILLLVNVFFQEHFTCGLIIAVIFYFLFFITTVTISHKYLKSKNNTTADKAVFGSEAPVKHSSNN